MGAPHVNEDIINKIQESTKEHHLLQESRVLGPHDTRINWKLKKLLNISTVMQWNYLMNSLNN